VTWYIEEDRVEVQEVSHSCRLAKSGTAAKGKMSVSVELVMGDVALMMDALADRVLSFCLQQL
jgi:hypothetical protein